MNPDQEVLYGLHRAQGNAERFVAGDTQLKDVDLGYHRSLHARSLSADGRQASARLKSP